MDSRLEGIWKLDPITATVFGVDSRKQTGEKLKEFGVTKACIFYDEAVGSLGKKDEMVEIIEAAGIEAVAFQVEPGEPNCVSTDHAADFARENNIDGLVGIGGGSTLDTAKMVGVVLANGGKTLDYLGYTAKPAEKVFSPIITLPTTAGTGAEVTWFLTNGDEDHNKLVCMYSPVTLAIVDPTYCLTMPRSVTANTGIDALVHASEEMAQTRAFPNLFVDELCKSTVEIIFKWLPKALEDGSNLEARVWMSYAALVAGYIIRMRGGHFAHPVANQLSNLVHCPHGVGCGIGMVALAHYCIDENNDWVRMTAKACGVECNEDSDMHEVGVKVAEAYTALHKLAGIPNLKALGVAEEEIDNIVDRVAADSKWKVVPAPPKFDLVKKAMHETYDF